MKIPKIKFPGMKQIDYVWNNGFLFQWCCTCQTRHIWFFHIVRGKTPDEDFIEFSVAGDPIARKLRKFYEKNVKKKE